MSDQGGGGTGTLSKVLADNPAAQRLKDEAQHYAHAMAQHATRGATQRVTDLAEKLTDVADGGSLTGKSLKEMAGGKNPVKAVGSAVSDKLGDGVKSLFGKDKKGGGGSKTVNILEEIDIGLPRRTVYNQWTQFQEFGRFTKGVQSADQNDETTVDWRAKIAFSTRSWKSTIKEQIPDQRIAWTSTGAKGSVDGVVSFHELTPDLTRVLLVLKYHPTGLFEKTGNLWRAQGRRARLDLKKFREFIMSEGEETGAWRGEIRDGDVVDDGSGEESEAGDRGRRSGRKRADDGKDNASKDKDRDKNKDKDKDKDKDERSRQRSGSRRRSASKEREPDGSGEGRR